MPFEETELDESDDEDNRPMLMETEPEWPEGDEDD